MAAHYCLIPAAGAYARAKKALATAARLQGESPEALYVEGMAALWQWQWKTWDGAYRRALELQPSHALILGSYGLTLCVRSRLDEGLACFERAREGDPLASFPCAITGVGLLAAGRARESERYFEDALSFEKENATALWGSGTAQVALGRFDEGVATLEQGADRMHRGAFMLGLLGWGLATAGRTDEARCVLEELKARPEPAPASVSEAWLLGALGDADAAWDVLHRAEEERQGFLIFTGLPPYDSLRDDPRFDALLERLGYRKTAALRRQDDGLRLARMVAAASRGKWGGRRQRAATANPPRWTGTPARPGFLGAVRAWLESGWGEHETLWRRHTCGMHNLWRHARL
jgi:serine/threonine-protein kinase